VVFANLSAPGFFKVMKFPDKPTCHGEQSPVFKFQSPHWREPDSSREPYGYPFRTCSFCGSIHPEDLMAYLESGVAGLDGSDWKYGWPHKYYVEGIPNPLACRMVKMGSRTEGGITTAIVGAAPQTTHAKWYNAHLEDEGYDDEAREKLFALLKEHGGIEFGIGERGLFYKAPYRGYQHVSLYSRAHMASIKSDLERRAG
jgi:hypothetical protein